MWHPLIFPGLPFMKTRVLSGRVDTYGVLALVWMWDRLRVQTWTGQLGSSPRPCACSFLLGWGRAKRLSWLPSVVVQEKGQLCVTDSTRSRHLEKTGEHHRAAAVRTHLHQGHRNRQQEGEQARIKISDQLRETRWVLRQRWGLCGGTETFRRQSSLKMQSGCHFSTSLLA